MSRSCVGKAYTAFTIDLSPDLKTGQQHTLLVRVDNRPNDRMLPRNKSYDWTDDGGIIRPVNLIVTPPIFIERIEIDEFPISIDPLQRSTFEPSFATVMPGRSGPCRAGIRQANGLLQISLKQVAADLPANSRQAVQLCPTTVKKPALWHFDSPTLYEAVVDVMSSSVTHESIDTFDIRKFEVRGSAFSSMEKRSLLIGVERMAGSHPELGMAETRERIESNHRERVKLRLLACPLDPGSTRTRLLRSSRHSLSGGSARMGTRHVSRYNGRRAACT